MKATGVILVGDPNQLLSVGSGNVLPDLLALNVPHIRLGSYHRQADADSALAYNVREFGACRSLDDLHFDDSFRFLPITDDTAIKNCVCRGGVNLYKVGADVQVLSPYNRSGILSSGALNVIFRECLNPATEENTIKDVFLRTGDRVIIQQNDWGQKVCNGDIGTYHHKTIDGVLYYSVAVTGTAWQSGAVPVRLAECLSVTVDRLLTGNQETDKTAFYLEVQELLGDCSTRERAILTEIAYAAKRSIREHKLSRPP